MNNKFKLDVEVQYSMNHIVFGHIHVKVYRIEYIRVAGSCREMTKLFYF